LRAWEKAQAADEKERKRLYVDSRAADVEDLNAELDETVAALTGILRHTLTVDDRIEFDSLKHVTPVEPASPGHLALPLTPPSWADFAPPAVTGLGRMFGGGDKQAAAEARARADFDQALHRHQVLEANRQADLSRYQQAYAEYVAAVGVQDRAQHAAVDAFAAAFHNGDPAAIATYCDLVLAASQYPPDFPQHFRLAYVPDSRQLVIEYTLPTVEVVPAVKSYRYVKASDSITEAARPMAQVRSIYLEVIVQTTLRTLHEVFEADSGRNIDVVVFNGMVDTTDPATGQEIRPCLLSVRATRDVFTALNLANVDPQACLKSLSATVSKGPTELAPVRPVVEFDMVDARFVEETDVLGELEQRPNLMELSPSEFEHLITNLFAKMGLETKQTQASRDGGVDCVAFDNRPIFGGKVVIQAKRYKGTVGVSAVRDLFGTVHNEGASKGILVTTSGYGQASFDFALGKPLELITGSGLLYLLAEHAGIEARIQPPEDWVDPLS
jgi:restriction system protein